ncbi:serine/threonine-protein kinase [Tsukamurella pseudospumae]|uniref:non-specific serine/threonine protein kinase n=1 Tax=Tsukamurella pseudospumae TaxID=239498 RepID=A0A138AE96_9ACTN|nr:serine/threonine-protein kinase [Tsukamurella pseudospumae]KXP08730.1 hypothetical protein AXK60_08630 [Tsukamurella pseudospumae]
MEEEQVIAGYRVVRRLGAGGMGEVFLVQHPRLPRRDALKLLDVSVSRNDDFKARFQREADLMAALNHPNIVTLYDRGEFEGRLWLSMEYVDGSDAAHLLRDRGPMALDRAAEVIAGAGAALDFAWEHHRITHRDVKPANILVAELPDGSLRSVKLADFGIAKAAGESTSLTSTGVTIGTMAYISPEALNGEMVDNRADIYSLGCAAFQLLAGATPFEAPNISALMAAHMTRPAPAITSKNPQLPAHLDAVFAKVLAKKLADRYQSCGEFVEALRAVPEDPAAAPVVDQAHVRTVRRAQVPTPDPGTRRPPVVAPRTVVRDSDVPSAAAHGRTPREPSPAWYSRRRTLLVGASATVIATIAVIGAIVGFRSWAGGGYQVTTAGNGNIVISKGRTTWLTSAAELEVVCIADAPTSGTATAQGCVPLKTSDLTQQGRSALASLGTADSLDAARQQAAKFTERHFLIERCTVTTEIAPVAGSSAAPTTQVVTQTSTPARPCRGGAS